MGRDEKSICMKYKYGDGEKKKIERKKARASDARAFKLFGQTKTATQRCFVTVESVFQKLESDQYAIPKKLKI